MYKYLTMITDSIVIASDHAGFSLKQEIISFLKDKGLKIEDLGTYDDAATDYPDFGHALAGKIESGEYAYGISICGTGNGISMTANKHASIRSGICWSEEVARLTRAHNDANICSLPARFVSVDLAKRMVEIFLTTEFDGGRHERRIRKIPL